MTQDMFWWLDMIHQNHFIIIILYYICLFFYIHYHQDQCCHKLRKSSKHAWRLQDFLVQRASNWTDIPQIGEGISSIPFQIGWYSRRYILWSEVSHSKWVLGAGWLLPLGGFLPSIPWDHWWQRFCCRFATLCASFFDAESHIPVPSL